MSEELKIKTNYIVNTVAMTGKEIAEKAAYITAIVDSENYKQLSEQQQLCLQGAEYHLKVASSKLHEFFIIYDEALGKDNDVPANPTDNNVGSMEK